MRDKIAMIIELAQEQAATMEPNAADAVWSINPWECGDKILALFPSLDGIVVEVLCDHIVNGTDLPMDICSRCKGTGTITRQAEWKEVIEWIKETLEIAEGQYKFIGVMKSGGRLKIREKD